MCGWVREETRPGTLVFLPAGCADGRGDDGVVCLVAWCHRRRIAGTGRNTGFVVIILAWALEDDVCFAGGGHGVRVDAIDPAAWQAFVELDPQEARDGEGWRGRSRHVQRGERRRAGAIKEAEHSVTVSDLISGPLAWAVAVRRPIRTLVLGLGSLAKSPPLGIENIISMNFHKLNC
jgi:hypothetical protein